VSEHQPEPISGGTGSVGTGPAAPDMSDTPSEPVTAQAAAAVESPKLAPEQAEAAPKPDAPKPDAPKAETPEVEAPKAEAAKAEAAKAEAPEAQAAKVETPKVEAPKVEAVRPEAPRFPGKLMIMSPGDRSWDGDSAGTKTEAGAEEKTGTSGKRRVAAMAAVVVLATAAGALGGALATAGFGHFAASDNSTAAAKNSALEASVARIDADILALKTSVEHTAKMGMSQFNKTSDRLDKVEKAQAEQAAKLAKLSEGLDKLRAAQSAAAPAAVAAQPAAAKDVTGTVPATTTAAPAQVVPAKPDTGRLPTVEGWVLRDVANGSALIENRRGVYEVYTGDPIPGLGRVDAIRRQDGRWVVVTSKGLIVAR
jgi:hypothetical protein